MQDEAGLESALRQFRQREMLRLIWRDLSGLATLDETLEELIPAGRVSPLIVVAVANGEDQRGHEYTPWYSEKRQFGGGGGEHMNAWIDILRNALAQGMDIAASCNRKNGNSASGVHSTTSGSRPRPSRRILTKIAGL